MKNKFLNILTILLLSVVSLHAQIKSKVWYDGNARVMYDRDVLTGSNLDLTDTVSTRSNGKGFSKIDLGIHFNPIKDIEIFAQLRIRNSFGGFFGNRDSFFSR